MSKNNIKVGDYVRTEYGISKVEKDRRIHYGLIHPVIDILKQEVIIKSSSNIIDLIEPMDLLYVHTDNGFEESTIPRIAETQNELEYMIQLINEGLWVLKGIVTKEQMEAMEYKIER